MESKSPKEMQVEEIITDLVTKIMEGQTSGDDLPIRLWYNLRNNQEIAAIQDYANMVSIGRLGLNDHGPVHMKTVCCNARFTPNFTPKNVRLGVFFLIGQKVA